MGAESSGFSAASGFTALGFSALSCVQGGDSIVTHVLASWHWCLETLIVSVEYESHPKPFPDFHTWAGLNLLGLGCLFSLNRRVVMVGRDLWRLLSPGRVTQSRWHRNKSRWSWNVPREGISMSSSSALPPSMQRYSSSCWGETCHVLVYGQCWEHWRVSPSAMCSVSQKTRDSVPAQNSSTQQKKLQHQHTATLPTPFSASVSQELVHYFGK